VKFPVTIQEHEGVHVVRDDLIGGTKRIYVSQILKDNPADEYVFATHPEGAFPIFMAQACREAGKRFTLVTSKRKKLHEHTQQVIDFGANIVFVEVNPFLSHLKAVARRYCEDDRDNVVRYNVAFGGRYAFGVAAIAARMQEVRKLLGFEPDEVFCSVGSGTLLNGLTMGTQFTTTLYGVMVGQQHTVDEFAAPLRTVLLRHRLKYQQQSKFPCPFPANANYERKAWEYCVTMRKQNLKTLFWNVYK